MVEKHRNNVVFSGIVGHHKQYSSGAIVSDTTSSGEFRNIEQILYQQHYWPPGKRARRRYPNGDWGGGYTLKRATVELQPANVNARYLYGAGNGWSYDGKIFPTTLLINRTPADLPVPVNTLYMIGEGAKGWNKYKPTNLRDAANVGQFLGEIREFPTIFKLLQTKAVMKALLSQQNGRRSIRTVGRNVGRQLGRQNPLDFVGQAADDFVNYEFGWLPLIKDVIGYFDAAKNADAMLRQLARDNGRPVRRGGFVDEIVTQNELSRTQGYFTQPTLVSYLYGPGSQTRHIDDQTKTSFRFAGRFRYYIPTGELLPPIEHERRIRQLARMVYGARFDAHLAYQLIPWSWLIDWFSSLGRTIDNIVADSEDKLVADYAYISAHKRRERITTVTGNFVGSGNFSATTTEVWETKERLQAYPYGFGLTVPVLNPVQIAILAALGIGRVF